jgi:hypothetical protein
MEMAAGFVWTILSARHMPPRLTEFANRIEDGQRTSELPAARHDIDAKRIFFVEGQSIPSKVLNGNHVTQGFDRQPDKIWEFQKLKPPITPAVGSSQPFQRIFQREVFNLTQHSTIILSVPLCKWSPTGRFREDVE